MPGAAHAVEAAFRPGPGAPQGVLVPAADDPLDVEAPDLRTRARRVAEAAEGDRELGRPALRVPAGGDPPDGPPVEVQGGALVGHERVELGAVRVRGEEEGIPVVVEGVERERHHVVARELRGVVEPLVHDLVAVQDPGDHVAGIPVPGEDADVERVAVEEDPHLRRLGRRIAFLRVPLPEPGGDGGRLPGRLVQGPVDADGGRHPLRSHGGGVVGRTAGLEQQAGGERPGGEEHAPKIGRGSCPVFNPG